MECRELEITLISAQNLENVRQFFKNRVRVYAKISLGGNQRTEKTTPVDEEGQTNPVWNFTAVYKVGKNAVKSQDIKLLIQFFCVRTSRETNIGEVSLSLVELFDRFSALPEGEGAVKVNYPVKRGDADSQGEVSLSYKFGDLFDFVRPPTNWGKVCWNGTKLIVKGGVLCARLTLLAGGNVFDVPIAAVVDVAYTSYDILSCVFGAGDFLADIPLGEADLLADISCPGTDVPVVIDTSSSLQSNAFAGRNLTADDLSIPSAGIQDPVDATSTVQTDAFGGISLRAESNNMSIDTTSAETDLLVDVPCSIVPTARRDARDDATFSVETNEPAADVPFSGGDNVPTVVDVTSREVSMDATFSSETNVTGAISCLKSNSVVEVTSGDETNAGSDVSFLDAETGKTNLMPDIPCLEADGLENDTFIIGEMTSETSCLQGDFGADDASNGETNKIDGVSDKEGDIEEDITNGETKEDIPCLEEDIGEDITCLEEEVEADGVTNKTNDVSLLEGDEEDAGETMEDISCLEEDTEEDSLCFEEEVEVDGTVISEINATDYILDLMSSACDLVNYLRAKLRLIIILVLFLFMLPILFFFLLNVLVVY